jgi:hypothetical protein
MRPPRSRPLAALVLVLVLAGLSSAPADPPRVKAGPSPLAQARFRAAEKQYEITWSYYQQNRIDIYQVYFWSHLMLDARRDMGETPADRIAALEGHLDRMKKLEALVVKIRRLGFGRSYDLGASEYYRLEAEYWLARANGKEK